MPEILCEHALDADNKESAASFHEAAAVREAAFGNATDAKQSAAEGLNFVPASQRVEVQAALAFAMAGDVVRAESLAQHLNTQSPLGTQMQSLWLPMIRAQMALNRKNPAEAIRSLHSDAPMELAWGSCLQSKYIRGEAYLASSQAGDAAAEFQKILDHTGIEGTSRGPGRVGAQLHTGSASDTPTVGKVIFVLVTQVLPRNKVLFFRTRGLNYTKCSSCRATKSASAHAIRWSL